MLTDLEVALRKMQPLDSDDRKLAVLDENDLAVWRELQRVTEDAKMFAQKANTAMRVMEAKAVLFWDHLKRKHERMEQEDLQDNRKIGVRADECQCVGVSSPYTEDNANQARMQALLRKITGK